MSVATETGLRILVVEDDAAIAELVRYNLEAEGLRPTIAPTGEEAELQVAEDRFDRPSQVGAGLTTLDVNESIPRVGPAPSPAPDLAVCQADPAGDVFIEEAVESHQDDRGTLPKPRGRGGGTGEGPKDVLLTLSDDDLGRLAWHGEGTPGDWQDSPSR